MHITVFNFLKCLDKNWKKMKSSNRQAGNRLTRKQGFNKRNANFVAKYLYIHCGVKWRVAPWVCFRETESKATLSFREVVNKPHGSWEKGRQGPLRPHSSPNWAKKSVKDISPLTTCYSSPPTHQLSQHTHNSLVLSSFHTAGRRSCSAQGCGVTRLLNQRTSHGVK